MRSSKWVRGCTCLTCDRCHGLLILFPPTEREVAERSVLIKNMLEDIGDGNNGTIPIPNVRYCCPFLNPFPLLYPLGPTDSCYV